MLHDAITAKFGDTGFLYIAAFVTGLLSGLAAGALKWLIGGLTWILHLGFNPDGLNWWLIVAPVIGVAAAAFFSRRILRHPLSNGTVHVKRDLESGKVSWPSKMMIGPMIGTTLTLGFGGSAGSEGPIAYTGAALGSNVGRRLGASEETLRLLVAIGAGAGIAGIFKAPVGGALFTLEVLRPAMMSAGAVLPLFIACITAGLIAYAVSGLTLDLSFTHVQAFDWHLFPWVILLGIICGLYSAYYARLITHTAHFYTGLKNPWTACVLSGLSIGVLLLLFPSLYGEGYGAVNHLLNGSPEEILSGSPFRNVGTIGFLLVILGIIAVKSYATGATNNGGGVGGNFAPTLFAGAMMGYLFAATINLVFGQHLPVGDFAFIAMAGVMAGAVRAPLMAIFLVAEMSAAYIMLIPLGTAAAISYGIVRLLSRPAAA